MVFAWATLAVGIAAAIYWVVASRRPGTGDHTSPAVQVVVLAAAALVLALWSVYLERPSYTYTLTENPVAIAIAFDLSPSMLAIPDPAVQAGAVPRFERGREVLTELFQLLGDARENVLVAIVGYTKTSEVIMGWESNLAQIREMLEYVVSPALFTSTGTSMEAGIKGLFQAYDTLPADLRENSRKIAILVSDGEDTLPYSYLDYAMEELEAGPFDIVTLQTGLLDTDEGVPQYGEFGEFLHFQPMGGRYYTVPDVDAMTRIAGVSANRGLYVRAENPDAAEDILAFIGGGEAVDLGMDPLLWVMLGIFFIVAALYALLLE